MHLKIDLLLLVVACVGFVVTQGAATDDPTSSDLSPPTSPPTTTRTTVTASTTTVEPTSSSTGHSKTTHKSTAVTSHSSSATTAHESSTHAQVSTTAQAPASDVYGVKNNNGSYCILLKAAISIDFKYESTVSKQTNTSRVSVPPPHNTTVSGTCGTDSQSIEIDFLGDWTLKLVFKKANDTKSYSMSEVHLAWNLKTAPIPDAPKNISGENSDLKERFTTSKDGYLCTARTTLYENKTVENGLFAIYTEQLRIEAFREKKDVNFSEQYERCQEDTISNLVPIIVGACLGGLIIVVLVAYLIGRKRSRRGYESV